MSVVRPKKTKIVTEYGDFQTPPDLALKTVRLLTGIGISPKTVIEPTCGRGAFVEAAAKEFVHCFNIIGLDINEDYIAAANSLSSRFKNRVKVIRADFFGMDWDRLITRQNDPHLIIGNPPWVTNSALGSLNSKNLPEKSNVDRFKGIDAITGKSNFDISEWMLLQYLKWLSAGSGTIAILCKSAVARKIMLYVWKKHLEVSLARVYKIDALEHFDAAVDACFFVLSIEPGASFSSLSVYDSLDATEPVQIIGHFDGHIVSDIDRFHAFKHLLGVNEHYVWRSGIKHDCSSVMELALTPNGLRNKLGVVANLEPTYLYPLLKSSDVGNQRLLCRSMMVVTQSCVGEDTSTIRGSAPRTWRYLTMYRELFEKRGSVIYRNKPSFSIFGVGPYTFATWKVAISGFYKRLQFVVVGPVAGRPVVFDDTVNFIACESEAEARFIQSILSSDAATTFLDSIIHWDDKRPITIDLLRKLSLEKLAAALGRENEYKRYSVGEVAVCLPL